MLSKINEGISEIYYCIRDGRFLEAVDCSCEAYGRDLNNVNQTQTTVQVRQVEVGVKANV